MHGFPQFLRHIIGEKISDCGHCIDSPITVITRLDIQFLTIDGDKLATLRLQNCEFHTWYQRGFINTMPNSLQLASVVHFSVAVLFRWSQLLFVKLMSTHALCTYRACNLKSIVTTAQASCQKYVQTSIVGISYIQGAGRSTCLLDQIAMLIINRRWLS